MNNFSFSHTVFKRFVLQTRKNKNLFGRVLKQQFLPSIRTFANNKYCAASKDDHWHDDARYQDLWPGRRGTVFLVIVCRRGDFRFDRGGAIGNHKKSRGLFSSFKGHPSRMIDQVKANEYLRNKKKKRSNIILQNFNEPCSVKRGLNAFAESIDLCQPAQSAQADMGQNFSLSLNFLKPRPTAQAVAQRT